MTDSQRVTWTAFAILAMFYVVLKIMVMFSVICHINDEMFTLKESLGGDFCFELRKFNSDPWTPLPNFSTRFVVSCLHHKRRLGLSSKLLESS